MEEQLLIDRVKEYAKKKWPNSENLQDLEIRCALALPKYARKEIVAPKPTDLDAWLKKVRGS